MNNFSLIFSNHVLWVSVLAWGIAQLLKVSIHVIKYKKMDFSRFVGSGGMPSSHSAFVTALAISIGERHGYNSTLFALATALGLIVMYDAAGVRRAAGKQAKILNKILEQIKNPNFNIDEKLKELLGHTPIEVIAGAALGIVVGVIFK